MQYADHEYRARDPAQPHSEGGDDHREPHVAGRPETVSGDEAQHPEERLDDRDQRDHLDAERSGVGLHARQPDDLAGDHEHENTGQHDRDFRPDGEFFDIVDRLVFAARAEALPDDRHHADPDAASGNSVHIL